MLECYNFSMRINEGLPAKSDPHIGHLLTVVSLLRGEPKNRLPDTSIRDEIDEFSHLQPYSVHMRREGSNVYHACMSDIII